MIRPRLFVDLIHDLNLSCRLKWHLLNKHIQALLHPVSKTENKNNEINDPPSSAPLSPHSARKEWVLVEHSSAENKNKLLLVEVESFPSDPNPTVTALTKPPERASVKNYTIEGEDPNLRITHVPSSHRVH